MVALRNELAVACVLVALTALAVAAQESVPRGGDTPGTGEVAQFRELTRLAHDRIERALLLDEEEEEDARRALFTEAERYGRAAAELMPAEAEGWFLIAASMGLRAQYESTRTQIRMAGEIWSMATTALDRDPHHPGAHHVMGRLNLEAMSLSGMARMIATHFYGSELLRRASWDQAEQHLRRAAQLEPDELYHKLWLARLYIEQDEEAEARQLLRAVGAMPARNELDRIWQEKAAEDLRRL